jgi:hypothetical protein
MFFGDYYIHFECKHDGTAFRRAIVEVKQRSQRSVTRWVTIYYLELYALESTLSQSRLHLQSTPALGPRGGLWPVLLVGNP